MLHFDAVTTESSQTPHGVTLETAETLHPPQHNTAFNPRYMAAMLLFSTPCRLCEVTSTNTMKVVDVRHCSV